MAEPTTEKVVDVQASATSAMDKFAEQLSKKREEIPVAEATPVAETQVPAAEVKPEVVATTEATTEKKETVPSSNGKAKEPAKEVQPEMPVPVKEGDDQWRKELGFDDTTTTTTTATTDNAAENETTKDLRAKIAEYETLLKEDKFIGAYQSAKKAGKDPLSFISDFKGADVSKHTPDQVWEASLNAEEGLTEEDRKASMEKFAELDKFEKIQKTKGFKQELINKQNEQFSKYAEDTTKTAEKQREEARAIAIAETAKQKEFFSNIKDKDWQGMKMTPSEINKLQSFLNNDFKFQNADGTINYELYAKVGNYALNERTILTNVAKKNFTAGYEKALIELGRPNNKDQRFNSGFEQQQPTRTEEVKSAAKSAFNPVSTN